MIKVLYNELDGPEGVTLRLEAAGHAGYAPAGQDIVCAGASTLMQALVSLLAGEESTRSDAWDEPDGPRLAVVADAPQKPWVEGAFELAKTGFALLAERYPDNLRFADVSRRGERGMMDLQLFAEGGEGAATALSAAQTQQAIASGTMKPDKAKEAPAVPQASTEKTVELQPEKPRQDLPVQRPELPPLSSFAQMPSWFRGYPVASGVTCSCSFCPCAVVLLDRMLTVCFSLTSAVCASIAASLTRPVPAAARVMVSVFPAVHCASSSLPLLVITPFHATFRFLLT